MLVLGIDPGITITGWALVKDGELLGSGTIKVPTRKGLKTFSEKLLFILELLGLENHTSSPSYDKVYIEQTFYKFKHAETSHHKFCGVMEMFVGSDKVEYIAPTTVKKDITGSGKATKEEVQRWVKKKFKVKFESPDEADAIAIAYAGYLKEVE